MDSLPPEPIVPDDWEPLDIKPSSVSKRSFSNDTIPNDRLRILFYRKKGLPKLLAKVWFGPGAEGPPHHAHGGSSAAVLDHVMGTACWMDGHPSLAGSITIKYRKMVPLGIDANVEAWIEKIEGRKLKVRGRILHPETGDTLVDGKGLFIKLTPEMFRFIDSYQA